MAKESTKLFKEAKKAVREEEKSTSNAADDLFENARSTLLKAAVALVVIILALIGLGVTVNARFAMSIGGLLLALSYVTGQTKAVSIPFWISFVVVVMLVVGVSPTWLTDLLPPVGKAIGFDFAQLTPARVAVTGALAILAIWVFDIWGIRQSAKKPDTIAKRVAGRAERLVGRYITIGRIIVGFGFTVGVLVLSEGAQFLGEIGSVVGDAPMVAANIANITLVHVSLGGSLPFIGPVGIDVTARVLVGAMVLILLAGAAVKYND